MKIYLAGKWEEHRRIKGFADKLRAQGYTISFPWFEEHLGNILSSQAALADYTGVQEAEVCVFLFEKELPYSGSMTELGLALAWNIPCIVVGEGGKRNIFTHHPAVSHALDLEEAEQWLKIL